MKKTRYVLSAIFLLPMIGVLVGHEAGKRDVQASWEGRSKTKVTFTRDVETVKVRPLVNWHSRNEKYRTEAGVSLLIEIDDRKILFDVGFNQCGLVESPLAHNVKALGVELSDIEMIFLSHRHRDHIGGVEGEEAGRLILADSLDIPLNIPVVSPTVLLSEPRTVIESDGPEIIAPALASTGPISRKLFLGRIDEQAMVLNVAGKGLIVVVGCGHQTTSKLIQRIEESFNEPILSIVGDLHFPVPQGRLLLFGIDVQRYLASGQGPFSPISWDEVRTFVQWAVENEVALFLGGHDTSDEVLEYLEKHESLAMTRLSVGDSICLSC